MTTDPRCPTTEAVNSRLLILPFCMDAIVHKHAATLRQLPRNIFDVGQSGSLGHYRPPSRILRKANCLAPTIITPIASTRRRNEGGGSSSFYEANSGRTVRCGGLVAAWQPTSLSRRCDEVTE